MAPKLICRNTFLEIHDDASDTNNSLRRSASAGTLSTSTNSVNSKCRPSSTPSRDEPQQQSISHHVLFTSDNSGSSSQLPSSQSDSEHPQEDDGIHYTTEHIPEDIPSIGSRLHSAGLCKPCHYETAKKGCARGSNCEFCHFPHKKSSTGSRANRPCKQQRQRFQSMIDSLESGQSDKRHAEKVSQKHPYLRKKLQHMLDQSKPAEDYYSPQLAGSSAAQSSTFAGKYGYKISL